MFLKENLDEMKPRALRDWVSEFGRKNKFTIHQYNKDTNTHRTVCSKTSKPDMKINELTFFNVSELQKAKIKEAGKWWVSKCFQANFWHEPGTNQNVAAV